MGEHKAVVKQLQGTTLLGKADSNHWVTMNDTKSLY